MTKKFLLFVALFASVILLAKSNIVNGAQIIKTTALKGIVNLEKSTFTIPDNGNGGFSASATLSPITSYIEVSCQDPDTCEIEIDNAAGTAGDIIWLSAPSTGQYSTLINGIGTLYPGSTFFEMVHDGIGWRIVG